MLFPVPGELNISIGHEPFANLEITNGGKSYYVGSWNPCQKLKDIIHRNNMYYYNNPFDENPRLIFLLLKISGLGSGLDFLSLRL